MHGSLPGGDRRKSTKINKPAWWPFPKKIRTESRFSEVDFTDSLLVVALGLDGLTPESRSRKSHRSLCWSQRLSSTKGDSPKPVDDNRIVAWISESTP